MKLLKLWRTLKEGGINFYRNGWLSFATVSILAVSLYIITVTVILGFTANLIMQTVQEKMNVSVYFNPDVSEEKVLKIKERLENSEEVKEIEFVSRETALEDLKGIGKNDPTITQALEEIGENPLLHSLKITASQPELYGTIADSISGSYFREDVNRMNYDENKLVIERLSGFLNAAKKVGLVMGIAFVFIGILITFNAIRLTMYSHKQEFEVMRLVGASNMYIRMPFVFEGIFYGITAAVIDFGIIYATVRYGSEITNGLIPQGNLLNFFYSYWYLILVFLIVSGVFLGVVSSFIAIRRYLKI